MNANPTCRICNVKLTDKNWYASNQKDNRHICKECVNKQTRLRRKANPERTREQQRLWRKANPEKYRDQWTRVHRKQGMRPFNENRECAQYLGIHVAEQLLSQAFKNVKRMPMNNPGYDIICNHNKKIDIKSSCMQKNGAWQFIINHNPIADFFLCLAFDNRQDLNPIHAWLIPDKVVSHLKSATIRPSTIHKWNEYRLDITKISQCCETMRKK